VSFSLMVADRQGATPAVVALDTGNGAELLQYNGSSPLRSNQFAHFVNNIFALAQLSFGLDLPRGTSVLVPTNGSLRRLLFGSAERVKGSSGSCRLDLFANQTHNSAQVKFPCTR
jgi:hypothetical protein